MSKILNLLNENKHWYCNDHYIGSTLEKTRQEINFCEDFNTWTGTRDEGKFKDFLMREVVECVYFYLIRDYVGIKYGFKKCEGKKVIFLAQHNINDFINLLIVDEDFLGSCYFNQDSIFLNIEGELYTEKLSNLSEELIKEAIRSVVIAK